MFRSDVEEVPLPVDLAVMAGITVVYCAIEAALALVHGVRDVGGLAAGQSLLFTFELAARLRGTGVTANCLHPGAIATGLLAEYFGRPRSWATLARVRYPGPAAGAKTSVYLATSPDVAAVSGRYFDDCQRRDTSPASHDAQTRIRLWDVSEQMVHLADHERLAPAH